MFASQAPVYEDAAKRAGDVVRAVVVSEGGHFIFVDPGSSAWPEVLRSIRALLGIAR